MTTILAACATSPDDPGTGTGDPDEDIGGKADGDSTSEPQIVFDRNKPLGRVDGFGTSIWTGDNAVEKVIKELELDYVRMAVNPEWPRLAQQPPADTTRAVLDAYVEANFNGDFATREAGVKKTWAMASANNAKVVLVMFDPPSAWIRTDLIGQKILDGPHLDDFARLWGSVLEYLNKRGLRPVAVELMNEPNIPTNAMLSAGDYNILIKLARQELNQRGFTDVGIVGPGLNKMDYYGSGASYVNALDSYGLAGIAAWSTHAWDAPMFEAEVGLGYLRERWANWSKSIHDRGAAGEKLVYLTEYGVVGTKFNGASFSDPQTGGTASNSNQYAVRLFENTLLYILMGTNVPMIWQGADQNWSTHTWGLLTSPATGSKPRPMFHAMKTLLPAIPDGATALKVTQNDSVLTTAAFLKDNVLVVAKANSTAKELTRTIALDG
ncbi:MAG: hypothetical protein AB7L28_13115, partial [Kofleriaceae bacterium]